MDKKVITTNRKAYHDFAISEKYTVQNKISEFCIRNKVSIYNFLMAVYSVYISKATNLDKFVIGTPVLNRTNYKEKHTTGMFITFLFLNTLSSEPLSAGKSE